MARELLHCLLLVAALSGCARATPTSGVDETTGPPSRDDCIEIVVSSSAAPPEDVRTVATEVVHGTFDGYGPSRWNTPDGHRPSKLEAQQEPARLIRSLQFTPIEQIVGDGSSLDRAMVPGGVSGCDRVSFGVDMPLTPGDGYVFTVTASSNVSSVTTVVDASIADIVAPIAPPTPFDLVGGVTYDMPMVLDVPVETTLGNRSGTVSIQ
jgi:hypothetical protein